MISKQLQGILIKLNIGRNANNYTIKNIGGNVYFGSVFSDINSQNIKRLGYLYFVKENDKYVCAVQYGGDDLHIFTLKQYRGHGYMSKTLKEWILPHIFYFFDKTEQKVTVKDERTLRGLIDKNAIASRSVFKKIGFKFIGRNSFYNRDEFQIESSNKDLISKNFQLSGDNLKHEDKVISQKINQCNRLLELIADISFITYGDDIYKKTESLKSRIYDLKNKGSCIK